MADTTSYTQQKERLEEIVVQIRAKDLPLEKSLDLYDEALAIGSRCADLLEQTDFTAQELEIAAEHPEVEISGTVA
jgi:exodeoxyribonuclease VII small subunit